MADPSGSLGHEAARGATQGVSLAHRAEFELFRALRGVVRLLPEAVALRLGEGLGWLLGSVLRVRRGVVDENLARAFPDRTEAWRSRVAAASYVHLGRETVSALRAGEATPEEIREMASVDSLEELRRDVEAGRGVVMVTGHLGSWELAGVWLSAQGFPVDGVAQIQRNRLFDRELRRTRESTGMTVMSKQDAPRGVLRTLRGGRVAGLVADHNVVRGGIFVDFFGVPAATPKGPALFALRARAPLWVGALLYVGPGRPRYRAVLRKVETDLSGDLETDVRSLTEAHTRVMENWVRQSPEQYFWLHKRWKTRPAPPEPE